MARPSLAGQPSDPGRHRPIGMTPPSTRHMTALSAIIVGLGALAAITANTLRIGYDGQWFRCMEDSWFIYRTWNEPPAAGPELLTVVAFEMAEAQAQASLGWAVGDTMIKRVLAGPGTTVTVSAGGVLFEDPDGRDWRLGRGLEAADLIDVDVEALERTITLGPGEYWMMGDMPYSVDSRYYGPVRLEQLTGNVVASW